MSSIKRPSISMWWDAAYIRRDMPLLSLIHIFIGCFAVRTCVEITCRNVRQNIPFVVGTVWIAYRDNIARAAIAIIQRFFKVGVVFQNILRKAAGFGRTLLRFQAIGDPAIHRVFECAPAAQRRRCLLYTSRCV